MAYVPFSPEARKALASNPYNTFVFFLGFAAFVLIYAVFYFFTGYKDALSLAAHQQTVDGFVSQIRQPTYAGRRPDNNATVTYIVMAGRYVITTPDSTLTSSNVPVYYDATNPANASLRPGESVRSGAVAVLVFISGLFLAFFVPGIIGTVRTRRRLSRRQSTI